MPSFAGELYDAEKISVDADKVVSNTSEIGISKNEITKSETEYEMESLKYIGSCSGENKSGYYNAFLVLKENQEQLKQILDNLETGIKQHAINDKKINYNAGYIFGVK